MTRFRPSSTGVFFGASSENGRSIMIAELDFVKNVLYSSVISAVLFLHSIQMQPFSGLDIISSSSGNVSLSSLYAPKYLERKYFGRMK